MTKAQMEFKLRTTLAALSATLMLVWRVFRPVIRLGVTVAAGLALVLGGAMAGSAYQRRLDARRAPALRRALSRLGKQAGIRVPRGRGFRF